jgi:cytochrome c-type biogenesis protein CcmH/NrfF
MKSLHKAAAVACLAITLAAQTVSTGNRLEQQVRRVGEKLKCFCGANGTTCSYTVGSCNMLNCHFREEVNAIIRPMVKEGVDEATILAKLKEKYGTMILGAPPAEGFNVLGWIMPFVAMALGVVAIRFFVVRWRRTRPASVAASGPPIDEKLRQQIEKELADLE